MGDWVAKRLVVTATVAAAAMETASAAAMETAAAVVAASPVVAAAAVIAATGTSVEAVAAVVAPVMTIDVAVVVAAAGSVEAMASPAVAVAPIGPGAHAEEDAVVEVAGAVITVGGAGIGGVVIVSPFADGRSANADPDLRAADGDAYSDLRASRCRRKCQTG